jgi:hypothetical protein
MTAFVIHCYAMVDGVPTDGLQCAAYAEARFLGTPPVLGGPLPDANPADGGPVASAEASGGPGHVTINVPDSGNYWIGCWDVTNPSFIAWEGPKMATPHTSLVGWTDVPDTSGRTLNTTYTNGRQRRLVFVSCQCLSLAGANSATFGAWSTLAGARTPATLFGFQAGTPAIVESEVWSTTSFPVDPGGQYQVTSSTTGTGSVTLIGWVEVDF